MDVTLALVDEFLFTSSRSKFCAVKPLKDQFFGACVFFSTALPLLPLRSFLLSCIFLFS